MTARILAGKDFAAQIKEEAKKQSESIKKQYGVTPGLAVVIVGSDPASQVYVRNKHKACEALGIYSEVIVLPEDTTKEALLAQIDALNSSRKIHGILVQLPLPAALGSAEAEMRGEEGDLRLLAVGIDGPQRLPERTVIALDRQHVDLIQAQPARPLVGGNQLASEQLAGKIEDLPP